MQRHLKELEFFYASRILLRTEKGIGDCREQIAAREIGRTMWTFGSKSFDIFMRVEFYCGTEIVIREQTAARERKRDGGLWGADRC